MGLQAKELLATIQIGHTTELVSIRSKHTQVRWDRS